MQNNKLLQFLQKNKDWAAEKRNTNPHFFDKFTQGQSPKALILGCSDSRVSPSVVLDGKLGDFFVHRNIANIVSQKDTNFLSVLQYAIDHLNIEDVVIYGHYGCGGIQAAYSDNHHGMLNQWLNHVAETIKENKKELQSISLEEDRLNRLVELNVLTQVKNIKLTSIYKEAIKRKVKINIHAWVYDFSTGLVKEIKE